MSETKYDVLAHPKNEMKFNYGGQAVIEGVMMRGQQIFAVAVRAPDGSIVVHESALNKALYRGRIAKLPFVRGLVGLWDALGLGTRALMWSADIALQEEETPTPAPVAVASASASASASADGLAAAVHSNGTTDASGTTVAAAPAEKSKSIDFNGPIGWATVAFSLLLGLGLFLVIPNAGGTFVGKLLNVESLLMINLFEGIIQLGILVGYISLIGLMPDTKRLFGYHGAEHKTINAYEAGAELTPEIVAQYPIEHPRCGTAFLLTVAFIGILVFGVTDAIFGRLVITRLLLIPLVAGISYEVLRWTAKNIDKPLVRLMITPNLALQHLTTRQPDLTMIEVAIVAFKRVLASEGIISPAEAVIPPPLPKADAQPVPVAVPAGD